MEHAATNIANLVLFYATIHEAKWAILDECGALEHGFVRRGCTPSFVLWKNFRKVSPLVLPRLSTGVGIPICVDPQNAL